MSNEIHALPILCPLTDGLHFTENSGCNGAVSCLSLCMMNHLIRPVLFLNQPKLKASHNMVDTRVLLAYKPCEARLRLRKRAKTYRELKRSGGWSLSLTRPCVVAPLLVQCLKEEFSLHRFTSVFKNQGR